MIIHQAYENNNSHPLETLFTMPYTDTFVLYKIFVQFTLENGKTEVLETRVVEREEAKYNYSDALQKGETAVSSYTSSPDESRKLLRIMLGNFPPNSKAYLRAICAQ